MDFTTYGDTLDIFAPALQFHCPACGHDRGWALKTKAKTETWTFECAKCVKQASVIAGAILHGSKLPPHL